MELGKRLGADVPFCLLEGTAVARGIGERLKALPPIPTIWLVLVKPPFSVSTAWAYKNIKINKGIVDNNNQVIIEKLEKGFLHQAIPFFRNGFEEVVITVYPEIGEIKERMITIGAIKALMSGSGPTVFGICRDEDGAKRIYNYFKEKYKDVFLVKTYNK